MSKRVFITGIGAISAIGNNVENTLGSIKAQKTGVGKITYLDTRYQDLLPAAEVKFSEKELLSIAEVIASKSYSRTSLLGIIAAKEALNDAGIKNISEASTGLVSSTSLGGMDKSESFYEEYLKDNTKGRLRNIITHDCGESTEMIADSLGVKDHLSTISTACSSAANAIMFGARLIKNNVLERVIVGGTDAFTKFTLNGFNSLMILDKEHCRPFDDTRQGLNLGEGAGYLVLESENSIQKTGKNSYCELKGFGNANDAYHQTASSPGGDGAYLAMKKALDMSGIKEEEIDYINAHGTGTINNDLSEAKAIERIFAAKIPAFSSTKAFTGHTLAAAGAIEAVLSVLAIRHQLVYPSLNFSTRMKELSFSPVTELKKAMVKNVLSNSFGFGGNNSSLIFSAC